MIKKYIIGSLGRFKDVITELEKLGGKNAFGITTYANNDSNLFYIKKDGDICYCEKDSKIYDIIIECFEEIKLPPVFVPQEFTITFVTELKTNGCEGCYFIDHENCEKKALGSCVVDKIIYKVKKQ